MLASFVNLFAKKKEEDETNSLEYKLILEDAAKAEEDMAEIISKTNQFTDNIEQVIPKTHEELLLEKQIDEFSLEDFLSLLEQAKSPEEVTSLFEEYQALYDSWNQKISLLRSEKHLKKYLELQAVLKMLKGANLDIISGKELVKIRKEMALIAPDIVTISTELSIKHQDQHKFAVLEKAIIKAIDLLAKDVGKMINKEYTEISKQLNALLKEIKIAKPDIKELVTNLAKIAENTRISEPVKAALQASIKIAVAIESRQPEKTIAPLVEPRVNPVTETRNVISIKTEPRIMESRAMEPRIMPNISLVINNREMPILPVIATTTAISSTIAQIVQNNSILESKDNMESKNSSNIVRLEDARSQSTTQIEERAKSFEKSSREIAQESKGKFTEMVANTKCNCGETSIG